jgi:hypothetical protein
MEDNLTMLTFLRQSARARQLAPLFWTGVLLFASGVFHVAVWAVAGMPSLEGPVSWRKPITFGFSTGLLLLTLTWLLTLMPASVRRARQAKVFSTLLIAEIGLIDMQQWRGVASHFNNATPFDGAVFTTMGILIVAASVIMALWTRDAFRETLDTTPGMAAAFRVGMVMLNVGNLIGIFMSVTHATSLKPLHGLTLHAIQALPIAIWFVTRLRYPRAWRDFSRV